MANETEQQTAVEQTPAPVDLQDLTKAELVAHAADVHGLALDVKSTKPELVKAIEAASAGVANPAADEPQEAAPAPVVTGVSTGNPIVQRGEYLRLQEASKSFVEGFGETTLTGFLSRVGSDGVFAQRVVESLLGERFAAPAEEVNAA